MSVRYGYGTYKKPKKKHKSKIAGCHTIEELYQTIVANSIVTESGCVVWKKGISKYPCLTFMGKSTPVHRLVVFLFWDRTILTDRTKFSCHKCHNTKCINPMHLYSGNAKTNGQDQTSRKDNYKYPDISYCPIPKDYYKK